MAHVHISVNSKKICVQKNENKTIGRCLYVRHKNKNYESTCFACSLRLNNLNITRAFCTMAALAADTCNKIVITLKTFLDLLVVMCAGNAFTTRA